MTDDIWTDLVVWVSHVTSWHVRGKNVRGRVRRTRREERRASERNGGGLMPIDRQQLRVFFILFVCLFVCLFGGGFFWGSLAWGLTREAAGHKKDGMGRVS